MGKPFFTLRILLQGLIEGMPQDYKIVCDELPSIKNRIHGSAGKRKRNLYWGGLREGFLEKVNLREALQSYPE